MKVVTAKESPIVTSPKLFDGVVQILVKPNEFIAPLELRLTRPQTEDLVREIFTKVPHTERLLAELTMIVRGQQI